MQTHQLFKSGKFFVGCNYWASHAGTFMWRNWNIEAIEADFEVLSANQVEVLRIFPLWPDFQPLTMHCACHGAPFEMRLNEAPLPDTDAGCAGVDEVMVERFKCLLDLAQKYNFKLIVGLITGWMSGRLYAPPAFHNVNILTDPTAIKYQIKMVKYLVRTFSRHPAIAAWDLGNECNCLAQVKNTSEAWNWTNAIASAIRIEDTEKPIVSGMAGLGCFEGGNNKWLIGDQAENTDILTTHPYPLFTPFCDMDRIDTFKNVFHAAAETRLYMDVGKCPAFVEEAGTLGPSMASDKISASYLKNMLWNSYAHDCRGLLWWCANDQTQLEQTPYDWIAIERELGMLNVKRQSKPVMKVMSDFSTVLKNMAIELPEFRRDAQVILTLHQDNWAVAYGAFLLAKKAGFDIEFTCESQKIKPADFYIMPSIFSTLVISRHRYYELLEQVKNGATLLVNSNGGVLQPFNEVFQLELSCRERAAEPIEFELDQTVIKANPTYSLHFESCGAEVLAKDRHNEPVITSTSYGKGRLIFCTLPIEMLAVSTLRGFTGNSAGFEKIYQLASRLAGVKRNVKRRQSCITLTEHINGGQMIVIAVNNSPEPICDILEVNPQYRFKQALHGSAAPDNSISIEANGAVVMEYIKN